MVIQADVQGKPKVQLRFSWLFGLVSKEITGKKGKHEEKKRAVKEKKKRQRPDARLIFSILRIKGVLKQFKELLKGVLSCFKFRDLVADFTIGLGDPADTGLLFAIIGPTAAFLGSSQFHQLRVRPSFGDNAVLQGYSQGTVRLRPIRLLPPFIKFACSLTTIRVAKKLIISKWRRKK
jgi:hypothetical protein